MVDNLSLALTHGLMLVATWLLLSRSDLDREPGPRDKADDAKPKRGWRRR